MVILSSKENLFQKRVDSTYKARILKSKKRFDVKTIVFPDLTEEYIQSLTHGVYQLKQAIPYTKEHIMMPKMTKICIKYKKLTPSLFQG